jgi:hypothetical protein
MSEEEKKYTEQECHKRFAVTLNNLVWQLLEKKDRTEEDNKTMTYAAFASCYHWSIIGEPINQQRGEWMLSHVFAILNKPVPALHHAQLCMQYTESMKLQDFDLAYAYEAMARAYAAAGDESEAKKYIALAQEAGEKIKGEEDKKIFMADFEKHPWFGMK